MRLSGVINEQFEESTAANHDFPAVQDACLFVWMKNNNDCLQ